jgi:hypothetical protein
MSHSLILSGGANVGQVIGEANYGQWLDLDRLLVQLWESYSIRPKAILSPAEAGSFERLLPGITKRGVIDLVEYQYRFQLA